jgi:hypothetical protein
MRRKPQPTQHKIRQTENSELRNLWQGDYLLCSHCKEIIYRLPYSTQLIYFRDISNAYFRHVKKCFSLKRDYTIKKRELVDKI